MESFDLPEAQEIGASFASQNKGWGSGYKFTKMLADNTFVENEYGKIYELEKTPGYTRLKIGADTNQIDLILSLCKNLNPPYFILYVLVIARQGHEKGRYQSKQIDNIEEVNLFLNDFKEFFETDGRHHIWVGTVDNSGLLIYDQHNVIFSYGKVLEQIMVLKNEGFHEMQFDFPVPHAHRYNSDNDKFEDQILKYWDWEKFSLNEDDVYE